MKPLYKLYKKIISESEEDISLDFAEDIDETYIELHKICGPFRNCRRDGHILP